MTEPRLSTRIAEFLVMRDLFNRCDACGAEIDTTPFGELVRVEGKNRLAHKVCPTERSAAA